MPDARHGLLIAVVGPSGAGKDSLLSFVRLRMRADPHVRFVRRVITRPEDKTSEMHEPVSDEEFERLAAAGDFAVTWNAHGLRYGIRRDIAEHVKNGGIAVANCSRPALRSIHAVFGDIAVILIRAERSIREERLVSRGRESRAAIVKRLDREMDDFYRIEDAITIDNNGLLDKAALELWQRITAIQHERGLDPES